MFFSKTFIFLSFCVMFSISNLFVWSPDELAQQFNNSEIPYELSNFGTIPYGKTILGNIFMAAPSKACQQVSQIKYPGVDYDNNFGSKIFSVDRGNCTFATKAMNCQLMGASAVIVINNNDINISHIVMGDDDLSTGKGVDVPVIMISQADGAILKETVLKNGPFFISTPEMYPDDSGSANISAKFYDSDTGRYYDDVLYDDKSLVLASLTFEWKHPDNRVEWSLVFIPDEYQAVKLIYDIYSTFIKLKNSTLFTPVYASYKAYGYGDNENCVCGGEYCIFADNETTTATGVELINESLREICIYNNYGVDKWFSYMKSYYKNCFTDEKLNSNLTSCSQKSMKSNNIKVTNITQCIDNSWQDNKTNNTLLYTHQVEFDRLAAFFTPQIFINEQEYRGNLDNYAVANAICQGFSKAPAAGCKLKSDKVLKNNILDGQEQEDFDPKIVILFTLISFSVTILFLAFFYVCYKRWVRRDMQTKINDEINDALTKYYALQENSKKGPRPLQLDVASSNENQQVCKQI